MSSEQAPEMAQQGQPVQQPQQMGTPMYSPMAQPQGAPAKPKVAFLDRFIKFIDLMEPILKIAHVVTHGIKEALHEYKRSKSAIAPQPPAPDQLAQQLGPPLM